MWSGCFYCVINIEIKQDEVEQPPASTCCLRSRYQKKGIPWKQQL